MRKVLGLVFLVLISFGMIACDGDDGERGIDGIVGPSGIDGIVGPSGIDGIVGPSGIDGDGGLDHVPDGYHVDLFEGEIYLCKVGYHYAYEPDDGHTFDFGDDHDGAKHTPACRHEDGNLQPTDH